MAADDTAGTRIRIEGRVFDGAGIPVDDAMIELWQADALGIYAVPHTNAGFTGFGRTGTGTDPQKRFIFDTIKPGRVDAAQAPHINVTLFMRGLLVHLHTRIYFTDEPAANASDPVLASVPSDRRHTLLAQFAAPASYRFDIHMQGPDETVFFDA